MYFIDVQGTLISDTDKTPLPCALEFVNSLDKEEFVIVTNNTKRADFKEYLEDLGFNFKYYLDPLMVLDEKIGDEVAVFGNENFKQIIENKFNLNYTNPKYVVLSVGVYSSDDYANMIEYILNGAKLIAMHKTSIYVNNNKRYPAVGAIAEMLKYATAKDYEVVGKPSKSFFEKAQNYLNVPFENITMISDDLVGDLLGAKELGMKTILTLTGKIKDKKEITLNPDKIVKRLCDVK
jgi:NagD protein